MSSLFWRLAGYKETEICLEHSKDIEHSKNTEHSKNMSENYSRRFSMDEIRKATDNFNKLKIIGEGGFGKVYEGVVDDESTRTLVAVKRALDPESKEGIQGLETEIKMLSKCRHSNLVTLLGYCNENQEMILVYEFMSGGNLADHLYGNRGAFLTWEQRLKICIGAARGLDYLHTGTGLSERIVHLDIKSDNILLGDNLAAKVADLGLSQVGPANQQNTQVNTGTLRGTEGYVDPEYLRTYTYSSKSDVYSFGVVLLEVLSGTSVWAGQLIPKSDRADWIQQYISEQTLVQIVDPKIVTTVQYGSLKSFVHTASNMLQLDSMKRPAMSSVVAQLESALELHSSSPVVDDDDDDPNEVVYKGRTFRPNFPSLPELALKSNVFFEPIDDKQMLQMRLDPSHTNKSKFADRKFQEMGDDDLKSPVDYIDKAMVDWGNVITTGCMIVNATGGTLTYVTSRNHYGAAPSYPRKIRNGQIGVFIHTKTSMMAAGSVGAVVYRGKYTDNASCDRMIAWSTRIVHGNAAYAEINEVGYFDVTDWNAIFERAKSAGRENQVTWKDCETRVMIERGTFTLFHAEMYTGFNGFKDRASILRKLHW